MNNQISTERAWGRSDLMVIAAVRYCLGRMSYIVSDCVDWLIQIWPDLSDNTRATILRDVRLEIERDNERMKEDGTRPNFGPLGMDIDRKEWLRFIGAVTAAETTNHKRKASE
jgi:hypothetical protein